MLSANEMTAYATRRHSAANAIAQKSRVAFLVERLFRGLQRCSPATWLVGRETDWYILGWLAIAAALATITWCLYPDVSALLRVVLLTAAMLRIVDITQLVVNLALFDRLGQKSPEDVQVVQDVTRSLVLLLWNFVELMIWFGLAYVPARFAQGGVPLPSRFYFSAITQLTIGYGDLTPIGWAKGVVAAQGVLGWLVTVILIARFVSSLPPLRAPASAAGAAQQ